MTFLAKSFIKNYTNTDSPVVRRAYGLLCGLAGILLNLLLCLLKILASSMTGSVSVAADALNNLSDAASSVVTIIGFRLASQKPDPNHPFGHGRIEYLSGFIVSVLILLMGFEVGKASVEKLTAGSTAEFHPVTVGILAASILVKFYMSLYNRKFGKRLNSSVMLATAADSLSDCAATGVVLICALLSPLTSFNLDGWCGLAAAAFILFSGIKSAKETLDPLLGTPPEPEFVEKIEKIVLSTPEISGMHDLIVHNYGPGRRMITLHAEVPQHIDILQIHEVIDSLEMRLSEELSCEAVIHMDPIATEDKETNERKEQLLALLKTIDPAITIHDFRMVPGPTRTNLIFDMVVPSRLSLSDAELLEKADALVKTLSPEYRAVIHIDRFYTKP